MLKSVICAGLISVLAMPAFAVSQSVCNFISECFEGETCEATDFELTIQADPENPAGLVMITDSETLKGNGLRTGDTARVVFFGESGMHAISVQSDAQARYTAHLAGPMVITYQGTCEVQK